MVSQCSTNKLQSCNKPCKDHRCCPLLSNSLLIRQLPVSKYKLKHWARNRLTVTWISSLKTRCVLPYFSNRSKALWFAKSSNWQCGKPLSGAENQKYWCPIIDIPERGFSLHNSVWPQSWIHGQDRRIPKARNRKAITSLQYNKSIC